MSYKDEIKKLKALRERLSELQSEFDIAAEKTFPVGRAVYFKKGRGEVYARVTMAPAWGDRVRVQNIETGKEYWVGLHFILDSEAGR